MKHIIGLAVICALGLRAEPARTSTATNDNATEGRLLTAIGDEKVDVPLAHTDVRIRVDGHLADATVTQAPQVRLHGTFKSARVRAQVELIDVVVRS